MQSSIHSYPSRALAWLMILALLGSGCVVEEVPTPAPGLPEFQALGVVPVPGGIYNVAAGNLMVQRADVSVDTRILAGTMIGATYNSASAGWHWSYEMRFDGETFVDREGAAFDVSTLADGKAIPGTYWVRVDSDTMKTKGGLAFDFDAQGRLDAVYWTSDPYPRYRYVHGLTLVEQRECVLETQPVEECRLVFTVELGSHGPTRIVDEESAKVGVTREALYAYDLLGRLSTARTPFEVDEGLPGTRYEYASGGLLAAIETSEGVRTEYRWIFEWLSQVVQIGEGDPTHAFSYPQIVDEDASLYSLVHANPLGGQTKYAFTEAGHVTRIERIETSEVMTVAWDEALNRPTAIVGFDGTVTQLQGWVDDDPTTVIEASGNEVQFAYEPQGINSDAPLSRPVAGVADSLGPVRTVSYDAAGRPITVANGVSETTSLDYVGAEVSRATAPWGSTMDFLSYGVHGYWRTAEASSIPEVSIQRKFDRIGNLIVPAAGLQEGGVLERAYDASRMLSAVEVGATDESGAVASTAFVGTSRRSDGQLLAVTRPEGADHRMEYDALGRLSRLREQVDGIWRNTVYTYDNAGNLSSIEQPNGMREEIDHDVYGRVIERRILRDGLVEAHALFEWVDGRVRRWYDSVRDQWETFTYDAAGRPAMITYSGLSESIGYEYDLRSRVIRKTFRLGALERVAETEWDLANRRTRVFTRDALGAEQDLVRLEYQNGRLVAAEYGNGLRRENLFDTTNDRFTGHRTTDLITSEIVEETTITHASKASPTRLEVTSSTETPLATTQEQYWLGLGGNLSNPDSKIGARVFRWQGWTWINDVLQDEDQQLYAWDELSNMVDDAEGDVLTYNDERNRLLAATVNGVSHTYTYDDAGYATSRDGMPIAWTAAGRLANVGPSESPLVEIEWDLAGRPVSVTALGATREFALFGGRVEYDATTGQTGWLHLTHVSLPFVGEERIYRHLDGLGNVSFTTDESGTVTSHRRYHPFGLDQVYGSGSFDEDDPRGFVGGIELRHGGVETGFVMLGARILDSDVGRFLSPDPIFNLVNAYTYANGNPVHYQDRNGRQSAAKADVAVAALELQAAQLDAQAADASAESAGLFLVAVAIGVIGIIFPVALVYAGVVGTGGAALDFKAARISADAAEIRVEAAMLNASAAVSEASRAQSAPVNPASQLPPPGTLSPSGGQTKRLVLSTEGPDAGGGVGPMVGPISGFCGPSAANLTRSTSRVVWLLLIIGALASVLISNRARQERCSTMLRHERGTPGPGG